MKIFFIPIIFISHLALANEVNKFPVYSLERADKDFRNDVDSKNFQFLSVCGYACDTPGIGDLDFLYCYSQFSKTKVIDNTGDFIKTLEQALFKSQAYEYALSYNTKLLNYFNLNNMNSCLQDTHWTSAFDKIFNYLTEADDLGTINPPLKIDGVFDIDLRKKHEPILLMRTICSILYANGIHQKVQFSVSNTFRNNNKWQTKLLYNFMCIDSIYKKL